MLSGQMEMSFGTTRISRTLGRRQSRLHRAQWWFSRMRQIVDRAIDREPAPAPRPEQTWFSNAYRQVGMAPRVNPVSFERVDERQICA
jgi:hypothetical protein